MYCVYVCEFVLELKVFQLSEFIRKLLDDSELQQQWLLGSYAVSELVLVRWENKEHGVFRITDSKRMATLWCQHKGNKTMTYEKLSRSLR